jgi:hypothetical protein
VVADEPRRLDLAAQVSSGPREDIGEAVSRDTGSRRSMITAGVNTLSSLVGLWNSGPGVTGVFQ